MSKRKRRRPRNQAPVKAEFHIKQKVVLDDGSLKGRTCKVIGVIMGGALYQVEYKDGGQMWRPAVRPDKLVAWAPTVPIPCALCGVKAGLDTPQSILVWDDEGVRTPHGAVYCLACWAIVRKCRVCLCTEENCSLCIEKTGEPCHWVAADLCSACITEVKP